MTRAIYRFREFTIRPESEPITSTMHCKTCGESGPMAEEFEEGAGGTVPRGPIRNA
ncbi:hypothetical protein [Streptomyces iranensis]|uniref:DUF7848 domain-containing protein n=1 Tax=Streptomyces iranensis TaxID=576784 RepID=UPI0039B76982